jgi:hypothetical protein
MKPCYLTYNIVSEFYRAENDPTLHEAAIDTRTMLPILQNRI